MSDASTRPVLAIVPARSGSKGAPGKNITDVAGKPLIAWTLEAARASACIGRIVVSTDSEEIAAVARAHGGETPFLRPEELARDDSPGIDVVLHALRWLEEHERCALPWAVVLQPTSPLRESQDIDAALELAQEKNADAVVGVCAASHHPYWARTIDEDGRLVPFVTPEGRFERRQDLPEAYSLNGALYLGRREVLLAQGSFHTDATYGYVMPPERSLDVNFPWDLKVADLVLRDQGRS